MVSSKLSVRKRVARSPAVCIGKSPTGPRRIFIHLSLRPPRVEAYQSAILTIDAFHPGFPQGFRYSAAWNPGCGIINPYPVPSNGNPADGEWLACGHSCFTWITVICAWPDGQERFAAIHVEVFLP